MTFYCLYCFAEFPRDGAPCRRCGAAQGLDRRDYAAKLRAALVHPLTETRRRAIFLLGEMRMMDAVGELVEIMNSEGNPFLVREAVVALGKIQGELSLTASVRVAHHRSFLVRARVVKVLTDLGGIWRKKVLEIAEQDPSSMVRENARSKAVRHRFIDGSAK
jgi:HEAT repeat protein